MPASREAAYEGEVKALVQQLYAVKGRAEGGLNACIASAKAEYKSLPPEQQTRSRKIAICMSKAGQLSALPPPATVRSTACEPDALGCSRPTARAPPWQTRP